MADPGGVNAASTRAARRVVDDGGAFSGLTAFRQCIGREDGFALLAVLWVIVGLAGAAAAIAWFTQGASAATRNRLLLTRAAWAREACLELVAAQYEEASTGRPDWAAHDRAPHPAALDSVALGEATWCRVAVSDLTAKLNINLASEAALGEFFADQALAHAVSDWRDPDDEAQPLGAEQGWYVARRRPVPRNGPFEDVQELRLVRGFTPAVLAEYAPMITTLGSGAVNLNTAPGEVLRTLPGIEDEAAGVLLRRRMANRPVRSLEELSGELSLPARETLHRHYRELAIRAVLAPIHYHLSVEGWAGRPALGTRMTVAVAPLTGRMAVLQKEIVQ